MPWPKGKPCPKETRDKISASLTGKKCATKRAPLSEEHKAKISAANKGMKRTLESVARSATTRRGTVRSAETRAKISAAGKGRVQSEESKRKRSIALLGNKNSVGRKFPEEHRRKLSLAKIGIKKSPETIAKFRIVHSGAKSNFWKGGITPLTRKIRTSFEYREWRFAVYARDRFSCVLCGLHGGSLNAHHIETFCHNPELRFSIQNGVTLCEPCHRGIRGKEVDFVYQFTEIVKSKEDRNEIEFGRLSAVGN